MNNHIHLGFEVGTGQPVEIPLKHMVITGQTQEAGKTTALEALIERSGLRALTFVTKRGEGSFRSSSRIEPYFREQADWQFVASVLEASRGEKLKFERAWIIRASKGARTLADVQRNVRKAMETAKGMSADVYLTLDAYLESVVPQIASVKWATSIRLQPGVNVMDMTGLNVEMQHLVIKSALDWVLTKEEGTVIVVPEAWKFIPQGRGTPVKLAAESYIRQGAGLGNYLWLDSQDIGGVEKTILRSAPLWLLGVQREINEIKRTLDNIPASVAKPKPAGVATLELGQFFACWGKTTLKTYVQPLWMDQDQARAVALGQGEPLPAPTREHGITVSVIPSAELSEEGEIDVKEIDELKQTISESNDRMTEILERIVDLLGNHALHHEGVPPADPALAARMADLPGAGSGGDEEALYQRFKARLLADAPALLKLVTTVPELHVEIQRPIVEVDGKSLRGRIARLLADSWFEKATLITAVHDELVRAGADWPRVATANELNAMTKDGILVQDTRTDGVKVYTRAPGLKVVRKEK